MINFKNDAVSWKAIICDKKLTQKLNQQCMVNLLAPLLFCLFVNMDKIHVLSRCLRMFLLVAL